MDKLIIHISWASGSSKTTLGNKLKEHFKSKIIVKDLDDLRGEFEKKYKVVNYLKDFDSNMYQSFLDKYILSQKKTIGISWIKPNVLA